MIQYLLTKTAKRKERERETDRETDRQTDIYAEREIERGAGQTRKVKRNKERDE